MTSEANTSKFYSEATMSADGEQIRAAFTPVERGWLIELQANGMGLEEEPEWAYSRSDAIIVGRQMVYDYTARAAAGKANRDRRMTLVRKWAKAHPVGPHDPITEEYTEEWAAYKADNQLEDDPKPKKRHGTFQVSKAFYEVIDEYRQAQGLKSWSAALTQLASIGYNRETGKEAPAASEPWGGARPLKDKRLE